MRAVCEGMSVTSAAKAYQVTVRTVQRWCQRSERGENLSELKRKPGSGKPRIMEGKDMKSLYQIVLRPASQYGYETDLWTTSRLRQVVKDEFKKEVSQPTMWRMLREADLTYQKPERKYFEANERERKEWLKKELPKILETAKKYNAILYFEDESSIALAPVLGKTWAPCGKTPKQAVTGKRASFSAISAVSKCGRLLFALYEKRIASDEVIEFLQQMLRHHPCRHLVVVMDQASPHTSKKTRTYIASQKRLHVFYLPKYSPDLNPDEKIWNHLKHQELKSHQAKTKEELLELTTRKLEQLSKQSAKVMGIFFRCVTTNLMN